MALEWDIKCPTAIIRGQIREHKVGRPALSFPSLCSMEALRGQGCASPYPNSWEHTVGHQRYFSKQWMGAFLPFLLWVGGKVPGRKEDFCLQNSWLPMTHHRPLLPSACTCLKITGHLYKPLGRGTGPTQYCAGSCPCLHLFYPQCLAHAIRSWPTSPPQHHFGLC